MIYNISVGAYETHIKKDWHKWFVWKPTEINGSTVWLKTVFRRGYRYNPRRHLIDREPGVGAWHWEYAVDLFELVAKFDDEMWIPFSHRTQGQNAAYQPPPAKP